MSILRHIIFFIYLFKNAVRVPIWSWASWLVDRVPRNSVFKTFGDKSKCLKYKWWSVNRVTGSWEMSERFSSWVFRGDVCWEGLWLSLRGPHTVCVPWLPSVPVLKSPQEIILFCWVGQKVSWGFSVSSYGKTRVNFLASPIFSDSLLYRSGLGRWSRGEQRWWNTGGRQGPEQASGISAAPWVLGIRTPYRHLPLQTHTSRVFHASSRHSMTSNIRKPVLWAENRAPSSPKDPEPHTPL